MSIESVKQNVAAMQLTGVNERELQRTLAAIVDAIQNIATKLDVTTAKLNADAANTQLNDTNYAVDFASTTAAIIAD
jgi:hypothetical protein